MANPQVADIIKQARLFVKDVDGKKFDDDTLMRYLNTGVATLYERKPSSFYVTAIVTTPPAAVEWGGEIVVAPEYAEALAHFVAAKCLIEGADDEFNAKLAKNHLDLFTAA